MPTWQSTQDTLTTATWGIHWDSLSTKGSSQSRGLVEMKVGLMVSACVPTYQRRTFPTSHPLSTFIGVSAMNLPLVIPRKSSFIAPLLPSRQVLSLIVAPWCGSQYLTPSHGLKRVLSGVVFPWDSSDSRPISNTWGCWLSMTANHWRQSSFRQPSHTSIIRPSITAHHWDSPTHFLM